MAEESKSKFTVAEMMQEPSGEMYVMLTIADTADGKWVITGEVNGELFGYPVRWIEEQEKWQIVHTQSESV
jgi:hypothetical protein